MAVRESPVVASECPDGWPLKVPTSRSSCLSELSTDDHRAARSGSAGAVRAAVVVLDAGPRVVVQEAQRMARINVRTRADASNAYHVVWRDGGS